MKKVFCSLLAVLSFCSISSASNQNLHLPRNTEKLLVRVQQYLATVIGGQKLKALEFVLPEKRELFLAQNSGSVLEAKMLGLDLTEDINRAIVRLNIEVLIAEIPSGRTTLNVTDTWVWRRDNWYLEVGEPSDLFKSGPKNSKSIQDIQKQIEATFALAQDSIDLGTIVQGEHLRKEIPIMYSGNYPLAVESSLALELLSVAAPGGGIASGSKHFFLYINTENWSGPFDIPLPVRLRGGGAVIDRTLIVRGNVFVPVEFRQQPSVLPVRAGERVSVFARNNTREPVRIRYITVDGKLDILGQPSVLEPDREYEIVLRVRPDEVPDRLYVVLDGPIYGHGTYSYRFHTER